MANHSKRCFGIGGFNQTSYWKSRLLLFTLLAGGGSFSIACADSVNDDPNSIAIVDLNAAMGLGMGPGNSYGTDLNTTDLDILANDLTKEVIPDVITLQEMAEVGLNGAPGVIGLKAALEAKTGGAWSVYFGNSGLADNYKNPTVAYYSSIGDDIGNPNEEPTLSFAGNAVLVREGSGIISSIPLTINPDFPNDYGLRLNSSGVSDDTYDGKTPGSVVGVWVSTSNGCSMRIYTTHISNNDTPGDTRKIKAEQITSAGDEASYNWQELNIPTVLTGDFNTEVIPAYYVIREDNRAMISLLLDDRFMDASFYIYGTTSKVFGMWWNDYDHIFTRLVGNDTGEGGRVPPEVEATVYDSRISDHRALKLVVPLDKIQCD